MSTFKIKGVGLDLTNLKEYYAYSSESIKYLHITLGSGNEYNNSEMISTYKNANGKDIKFLVTVNDINVYTQSAIKSILNIYGLEKVDLLFIDAKCDIEANVDYIVSMKTTGLVDNFGISNPKNLTELIKVCDVINGILTLESPVKYLAMPISPLDFDTDILDWVSEKGISVFGFNPFGGHITSGAMIDAFSIPYLLGFSAKYCDVVVLSCRGDKYDRAVQQSDYLMKLSNKEMDSSKYTLTVTTKKLFKPLNKLIYTSLGIDKNNTVYYEDPELISDPNEIFINFIGAISQYNISEEDLEYKITVDKVNSHLKDQITTIVENKSKVRSELNIIFKHNINAVLPGFLYNEISPKYKTGDKVNILVKPFEITNTITIYTAKISIIRKGWFGNEKTIFDQTKNFMFICTGDKIEFTELNKDNVSQKV